MSSKQKPKTLEEIVCDLSDDKNVQAWAENDGRNALVAKESNSVTTKVTGAADDPYKASTNIFMPNATLIDGKAYRISLDVKATKKVEKVNIMMGDIEEWDPSDLFVTDETVTYNDIAVIQK